MCCLCCSFLRGIQQTGHFHAMDKLVLGEPPHVLGQLPVDEDVILDGELVVWSKRR